MKSRTIETGNERASRFMFDNKTRIVGHFDNACQQAMMISDLLSSAESHLFAKGGQHVTELY
jgi:hypothetical protein